MLNFILRDNEGKYVYLFVLKNTHIDWTIYIYIYEVLQKSIVKHINDYMNFMNKDHVSLYFVGDIDNNIFIQYTKNHNQNEIDYVKVETIKQ